MTDDKPRPARAGASICSSVGSIIMGLLKAGKPLTWQQTKVHSCYIREHGVRQFLSMHRRSESLSNDRLYYGDEIEYGLLKMDATNRTVRLSLRGADVMEELRQKESNQHHQ